MNSNIYKIPKENVTVYQSLVLGVILNNLKMIKHAESLGADFTKIKLIDERIDGDSESFTGNEYISLADYVEKYSQSDVEQYITKKFPVNADRKNKEILKIISGHNNQWSQTEIIERITPLINAKNINEYFLVNSPHEPISDDTYKYSVSFLHIAIACSLPEVVEFLLSKGANPNLVYKHDRGIQGNPGTLSVKTARRDKSRQYRHHEILFILLKHGANFTKINKFDRQSTWGKIIDDLPLPVLKPLLMKVCPQDLEYYEILENRSQHLFNEIGKKYDLFKNYPLLDNIVKNEKVKVRFRDKRTFYNSKDLKNFFKEKSMTKALSGRYGISSPKMISLFQEQFLRKSNQSLNLDGNFFIKADFFKNLFVDELKNPSDFLLYLEKSVMHLDFSFKNYSKDLAKLLARHFTQDQIKEIVKDEEYESEDILTMYRTVLRQYEQRGMNFDEYFKGVPFKEVNSLSQIHQFLEGEVEKISQKDYKIDQTEKFPSLKEVPTISLPKGYGLKLATSNYELIDWGNRMDHCIGSSGYGDKALEGTSILLAITYDNEPKYAMEILNTGELNQVQGYSHSKPPLEVSEQVIRGLKKIGIIKGKIDPKKWAAK